MISKEFLNGVGGARERSQLQRYFRINHTMLRETAEEYLQTAIQEGLSAASLLLHMQDVENEMSSHALKEAHSRGNAATSSCLRARLSLSH